MFYTGRIQPNSYGIPEPVIAEASHPSKRADFDRYNARNLANYNAKVAAAKKAEEDRNAPMEEFKAAQDAANAANELRYQQGLGIFDEMTAAASPDASRSADFQSSLDLLQSNVDRFSAGGGYGEGARSLYAEGARKSRASAFQGLVSSGMSNLTGSYDRQAAFDTGLFNKQVEDTRIGLQAGAVSSKAGALSSFSEQQRLALERAKTGRTGFIERREDIGPDPQLFSQLMAQAASADEIRRY